MHVEEGAQKEPAHEQPVHCAWQEACVLHWLDAQLAWFTVQHVASYVGTAAANNTLKQEKRARQTKQCIRKPVEHIHAVQVSAGMTVDGFGSQMQVGPAHQVPEEETGGAQTAEL